MLLAAWSKSANILFAIELNRRLEGSGVIVNSLHPGVIVTELGRHFGAVSRWLYATIGGPFTKTIPQGE